MELSQPPEPQVGFGPSTSSIPFIELPHVKWLNGRPFAISRLDSDYAKSLEALAIEKENYVKSLPLATGWETAFEQSPTTSRFVSYSTFLLSPKTFLLFFAIRETYYHLLRELNQERVPRFIQCWYNVHRCGSALPRHQHVYPFIGTFSAHAEGSPTRYGNTKEPSTSDVEIEHVAGQILITTGKNHYHDTSIWEESHKPRITYAFDILDVDQWIPNGVFLPFDI